MKLGMNPWTVYGWELPESIGDHLIKELAKIGCQGLELVLDEGKNTAEILITDKNKLTDSLQSNNMEVTSVATALFWQYNLASQNADVRQKGLKVVRDGCEIAQAYDVPVFLVVAGLQEANVEYERTYETAVITLQEAGKIAADLGGIIGVENVPSSFLMSP
ncbi:MAG: TIM barrel protein, partial [Spirochaetes bacterium]|nr:TIM barrel protein [Spirochaetota bacterium]